jgi:hypothetical protein
MPSPAFLRVSHHHPAQQLPGCTANLNQMCLGSQVFRMAHTAFKPSVMRFLPKHHRKWGPQATQRCPATTHSLTVTAPAGVPTKALPPAVPIGIAAGFRIPTQPRETPQPPFHLFPSCHETVALKFSSGMTPVKAWLPSQALVTSHGASSAKACSPSGMSTQRSAGCARIWKGG